MATSTNFVQKSMARIGVWHRCGGSGSCVYLKMIVISYIQVLGIKGDWLESHTENKTTNWKSYITCQSDQLRFCFRISEFWTPFQFNRQAFFLFFWCFWFVVFAAVLSTTIIYGHLSIMKLILILLVTIFRVNAKLIRCQSDEDCRQGGVRCITPIG